MSRGLTRLVLAAAVAAVLAWPAGTAWADEDAKPKADTLGLSVPRGSKVVGEQLWNSRLGFRKTVKFYAKYLERKGIDHEAIPVYRYRGVAVARFLAKAKDSRWQALQIFLKRGVTRIAIVPANPP